MSKKIISTILFLIVGVIMISLFLMGSFREQERGNAIEEEVNALIEEAKKIGANNDILEERIAYFQSNDFQEMEAKKKLNLKKEGEEVVVIKPTKKTVAMLSGKQTEPLQETEKDTRLNYQKWWDYLFNR